MLPAEVIAPTLRQTEGLVARLRHRLFEPRQRKAWPAPPARREVGFRAGIAEVLLLTRLRARHRSAPSPEMLARAALMVQVTCKSWFGAAKPEAPHRTRI